ILGRRHRPIEPELAALRGTPATSFAVPPGSCKAFFPPRVNRTPLSCVDVPCFPPLSPLYNHISYPQKAVLHSLASYSMTSQTQPRDGERIPELQLLIPPSTTQIAGLNSRHGTNYDHQYHQFNNQPSASFVPPETAIEPTSSISEATSILHALEKQASTLQQERDKAERVYREAQLSVARYRALCGQMHNSQTPLISQLPVELLIHIFLFLQNTVVASQVCRYWRVVALSCPKLWSSLHVHPSKGSKHLENLLARSLGQNID
ncbi:10426_t:CDS:2, partial [Acaulospora colombiana]